MIYTLTPKAFPADTPFEPIPWTLAIYAIFTLIRLRLALRDRLAPWFLSLSAVIDVAVLMVTIWSFHLQYGKPATIYLKVPTLLYVFILIALRTLRFEAGYVLLAGAAALIGWAVLVGYALATAGEMGVTRDFAEYMTSRKILIGAEIDKLVSIGAVTLVLAAAVVRARRLMIRAAVEAHAAATLTRFLPNEAADALLGAGREPRPGEAVARDAAVMFLDLRDFTTLADRLPPEETVALLGAFHTRAEQIIRRHGGSIDKYLGDGVLATFGAMHPASEYAADALRALDDVLAAFEGWNAERAAHGAPRIGLGAAVTAGRVLVGVTGAGSRLEFTVLGNSVNVAAKLEKHCKLMRRPALVMRAAFELARAQGYAGTAHHDLLYGERPAGLRRPIDLMATGAPELARSGWTRAECAEQDGLDEGNMR